MKIKFFTIVFLLSIIFSNSYSQQDVNGWYWLNGRPTGNTLNWVKIINSSTIYAVGDRGTFMKSTDGGDNWSVNNQVGSPDNSSTGGLATRVLNTGWFFDANTGMVAGQSLGTNTGLVSRTTNGGNSWTYVEYNPAAGGVVTGMYFLNSTTGYLCGNGNARLFKTTNQGLTWTDISGSAPENTYSAVYALNENTIYLAAPLNTVAKTTDAGASWSSQILPGPSVTITDVYFKDANTGYASGNPNYFAYTTNGGSIWNQSNPPSAYGHRKLKYSAGSVYLVGAWTEIYKSTNNGVSWSAMNFIDGTNPNQPFQFYMYGMDVNGSDIAVVGNGGIVNLSNDDGASWRNKNYSVSNNIGAYGNETYSSMYVQPSAALDGSGDDRVWVGPNGGGKILYSTNGGMNWTTQVTSHTTSVFSIDFINSNTGYIAGGNAFSGIGQASKTTNGGASWIPMTLAPENSGQQLNSIDFINENTGWVFGGLPFNSGIACAKTTNGGINWTQQPNDVGYNSSCIGSMADANTGWFVGGPGLFKTTNGGNNWIRNTDPYLTSTGWSSLFVFNKDIVYLNGGGTSGLKKIIRSIDGGNTWTDITSNLLTDFTVFKTYWLNLKHGIVSGTNGYSAKTTDGGLTWTASNPGGSTTVALSLPSKNAWYTASDRNSYFEVWRKIDNLTSISVNVTMGIEGFWNGSSMVPDTVTVELHNSTSPFGLVASAKEVVTAHGYATYEFNSVASGSYYIVLKHRNSIETWSAAPVVMVQGGNYNYNFTTAASQAFGNNMILKLGQYNIYGGDINQDGIVDGSDGSIGDNQAAIFLAGYSSGDVNGDSIVDGSDLSIVDNNSYMIVISVKP